MITASMIHDARILIVDELEVDARRLEPMLGSAGYTFVNSASHPQAAIKMLRKDHYDLVILDLDSLGVDCVRLIDAFHEVDRQRELPVLVMTADIDQRYRALKNCARDFISKPFDKAEVLVRVRNILEASLMSAQMRAYGMPLALFDELTGLPNRVLFMAALQNALRESSLYADKAALVVLDLDRFKNINAALGHKVGDECLRQVARRLGQCRRDGMMFGRTGGDEFAFAIPHQAPRESVPALVEQIFETLKPPFLTGEWETIQLSASIGMAFYPANAADAESLMGCADEALYRAKEAGRNTWRSSG